MDGANASSLAHDLRRLAALSSAARRFPCPPLQSVWPPLGHRAHARTPSPEHRPAPFLPLSFRFHRERREAPPPLPLCAVSSSPANSRATGHHPPILRTRSLPIITRDHPESSPVSPALHRAAPRLLRRPPSPSTWTARLGRL